MSPPPDLAFAIDISRSSVSKLAIYAAFGVREVWGYDGATLPDYLLDEDGNYQPAERSEALPGQPVDGLVDFLRMRAASAETQIVRQFQDWLRALTASRE